MSYSELRDPNNPRVDFYAKNIFTDTLTATTSISAPGTISSNNISATTLVVSSNSTLNDVNCHDISSHSITNSNNIATSTLTATGVVNLDGATTNVNGTLNALSQINSSGIVDSTNVSSPSFTVGSQVNTLQGMVSQDPAQDIMLTNISSTNATITGGSAHLQFVKLYDNAQINFQYQVTATATSTSVSTWQLPASIALNNFTSTSDVIGLVVYCDHSTGYGVASACLSAVIGQKQFTYTIAVTDTNVYDIIIQFSCKVGRS